MKIGLIFPPIMKMEIRADLEIDDYATFPQIKQAVLVKFFETMQMQQFYAEENPGEVRLIDYNHIDITSTTQLKNTILKCTNFWVVFRAINQHEPAPPSGYLHAERVCEYEEILCKKWFDAVNQI